MPTNICIDLYYVLTDIDFTSTRLFNLKPYTDFFYFLLKNINCLFIILKKKETIFSIIFGMVKFCNTLFLYVSKQYIKICITCLHYRFQH